MAARPMAKPAPTAESAGIQTPPVSAAWAVVGVTAAATPNAPGIVPMAVDASARCNARGAAGTKARQTVCISAAPATSATAVSTRERGAAIATSKWAAVEGGGRQAGAAKQ